jgi:hypothetical protein
MYSKEALFGNAPHLSTLFQAKKTNSARKKKKSLRTHTHTHTPPLPWLKYTARKSKKAPEAHTTSYHGCEVPNGRKSGVMAGDL